MEDGLGDPTCEGAIWLICAVKASTSAPFLRSFGLASAPKTSPMKTRSDQSRDLLWAGPGHHSPASREDSPDPDLAMGRKGVNSCPGGRGGTAGGVGPLPAAAKPPKGRLGGVPPRPKGRCGCGGGGKAEDGGPRGDAAAGTAWAREAGGKWGEAA